MEIVNYLIIQLIYLSRNENNEPLTRVWQKWQFSVPKTHLWLIKHLFSASTFVVKIATFAKPETVSSKPIDKPKRRIDFNFIIMYCIETNNLTYRFSEKEIVLKNINLKIPQGSIFGFLGPNGAGKTTTLKLILGLLKKQEGTISIFNKTFDENRIDTLKKIGSLIEAPSLYAHLTAEENLKIWQKIYQCSVSRINEVLEIVGLSNTGNKKAGQFSLGMKQRLSIAIALLHNPTLLILDEPTNGLDPSGILEIRELLTKLNNEQKITIVISSHLLAEIEKMVTHIGIINKGSILFQGTLDELHIKQAQTSYISFETDNVLQTSEIIKLNNLIPTVSNNQVCISNIDKKIISSINSQLVNNKIEVYQISTIKNDLESIFIDLTKN